MYLTFILQVRYKYDLLKISYSGRHGACITKDPRTGPQVIKPDLYIIDTTAAIQHHTGTPQIRKRELCGRDHLTHPDVSGGIIQVGAHDERPPVRGRPHAQVQPIGRDDVREVDAWLCQWGGQ